MTDAGAPFRVALTFDAEHPDRPSAPFGAEQLLDALERNGIPATFFVQGRWAEAYPELVRRIRDAGHLIGSHSHYHVRMPLLTAAGLRADIATAERALWAAARVDPKPWFRCPFGSGAGDRRVRAIIEATGYRHVGWHVEGRDWRPERGFADVADAIVDGSLGHGDGCVALLHSWPERTWAAIDLIAGRLRERGATFVPIDQLDVVPAEITPVDELEAELEDQLAELSLPA